MRKSILVLTATLAAAVIGQTVAADARGGRGFGMSSFNGGGLSPLADPTILAGVAATQRRAEARRRGAIVITPQMQVRQHEAAAARARAAEIAARKREAAAAKAALAAKAKAEQIAAAREAKAAAARRSKLSKSEAGTGGTARVTAPVNADQSRTVGTAQSLETNQAAQLLKSVDRPVASTAPKSAAAPVVTPAAAATNEARKPATGDCKRFVPGAGITVSVSCTE